MTSNTRTGLEVVATDYNNMTGVNWFGESFGIYFTFTLFFLLMTVINVINNFKR